MTPVIIFENDEYLVVDKPAGLMVHGDGRSTEKTLVDWLLDHKKVSSNIGEPWTDPKGNVIPRPGIVHRLDRDTSGLLAVAKTQAMYEHLKKQFQERSVTKEYVALVHGDVKESSGVIDRPIGSSASDFRKKSAQRGAKGNLREAVTEYRVLKRFPSGDVRVSHDDTARLSKIGNQPLTLLALFPKTGRTHQLRVHMKAINHPIVGDTLYGRKGDLVPLCLRARALSFRNSSGEDVSYEVHGTFFANEVNLW